MGALNHGMNRFFDLLLAPLAGWPPLAMVFIAALSAVWALLLFKAVTPQQRLTSVRDRLFGHIYEMGLYQNHMGVVARIQGDLALTNLRYLLLTLPALVVLAVPMVLTLAQLEGRFGHRPLLPGEDTVLSVTLAPDASVSLSDLRLEVSAGMAVKAGPVRDLAAGAVAWRLQVLAVGPAEVVVRAAGREIVRRTVPSGTGLEALGEDSRTSWWRAVLTPGAPVLSSGGPVVAMSLSLPARTTEYLGVPLDWLVAFMVFSMAVGLAIKGLLGVSI